MRRDESSEGKLQLRQQCNKEKREECGTQREYYKSYKESVGNVL